MPAERRRGWAIDTTPLRNPRYRRLFWGVAATMLGQQMTLVAVPFQVYALTGSSLLVGVTSIVALVPLIVFGLLGGAIADAMDRRRLMLITSVGRRGDQRAAGRAGAAARRRQPGAAVGADRVRLRVRRGQPAHPQRGRSRRWSGRPGVPAANALSMTVRQVGVIVGPLLAGLLIGLGELFLTYAVDALGFLVAALLLRGLPSLPPGGDAGPLRLGAAVRGVGEGFAFLRTQPVLLMTFVVDIIAMLFAWPQAVFPELSRDPVRRLAEQPGLAVRRHLDRRAGHGADLGLGVPGRPAGRGGARRDRGVGRGDHRLRAGADRCGWPCSAWRSPAPATWSARCCARRCCSWPRRTRCAAGCRACSSSSSPAGPRLGDLRAGAMASAASVTVAMVSGGVVVVVAMVVVALRRAVVLAVPRLPVGSAVLVGEARPDSPAPESDEDRPGARAQ